MSGILHDPPDHGSVEDEWEEPTPLRALVDLPAFPVEVLPDFLAAWVRAEAIATQTPPDLAGMLVLTALAAAAGGLAEVQLRPGWREPLNLFTATTLPPGNRKSAVFRDVTRPLVNFDRDEAARMQTIVLEAITARKVAERAADAAQATAGKATGDGADAALAEAIAAAARAEAIHVPSIPRLLADDATPEALATLLADHGRISLLSPEGGVFDMMAGRYQSGGPSLDVYLKGHAGDAIRVDRKGRPAEYVEQPALTVGLAVQPEVLRACKDRPGSEAAAYSPASCTRCRPAPWATAGSVLPGPRRDRGDVPQGAAGARPVAAGRGRGRPDGRQRRPARPDPGC